MKLTLYNWIKDLVQKYNIDGIRIDTIPEVPKWFWKDFAQNAGVFQIGEVFDGRLDFVADYQKCCIDSVLNYPLYYVIRDGFMDGKSLYGIEKGFKEIDAHFSDTSVLGSFVNNHDNFRFLNKNNNHKRFNNAIIFSLLTRIYSFLIYFRRYSYCLLWR